MERRYAKRMDGLTGNAIRDLFKYSARPGIISFAGGLPAPFSFPCEDVSRICSDVIDCNGKTILQYGETEGYRPLRETVAGMMNKIDIQCNADNVLITAGSLQGAELMARAFLDEGDAILVESPTFLGVLHTFKLYRPKFVPVEMDDEGMEMADLEGKMKVHHPKFLYVIPTFQNPTGKTLGLERRKKVLELARKYDVIILEDDPYRDLRYFGESLPAIASMDEGLQNVVYLMSFSKILSPGLRVGALIAEPALHRKLTICKQGTDVHTSLLAQAVADEYVKSGALDVNLPKALNMYREQLSAMLEGFSHFPKNVVHTKPEGGLFVWVELPKGINTTKLLIEKSLDAGVSYIPGEQFYTEPGHENTMRLNFSACPPETIRKGMEILGGVITEAVK